MNLRNKLGLFALTKEEQRTIAFIVLVLMLGVLTKHYRFVHHPRAIAPHETHEQAPTSPPEP